MYERAGQYCAKFRLIHNLAAQFIEYVPQIVLLPDKAAASLVKHYRDVILILSF